MSSLHVYVLDPSFGIVQITIIMHIHVHVHIHGGYVHTYMCMCVYMHVCIHAQYVEGQREYYTCSVIGTSMYIVCTDMKLSSATSTHSHTSCMDRAGIHSSHNGKGATHTYVE